MNMMNEQPEVQERIPPKMSFGRILLEILQTIVLAVALYFGIDAILARVRVENISMKPTLVQGEFLLVNKLAYRLGKPAHGDIIVFRYDPTEDFIKRVIGLPGDVVEAKDGTIYINQIPLTEPYVAQKPDYTGSWQVPQDSLFVLGDNRNQSSDSHIWGFVKFTDVIGKAIVIYWPFDAARIISKPVYAALTP
jgi:signal peptidase I